ncbi:hypothetical protein [Pandoraea sputorum]|uniref:Uncharacterized protein n=1 Tax=Pandoraea sputorum TaxID=93222 RepID=A0A239SG85_9BURK|nr:hypothetical protein [Pandoraea sputorum]APD12406.1 hypothetical protein NA29_25455 [Pandoraea sputorum]SNU84485.1 Uncharacterised protein [Pandoraea sputorum]VVD77005.1 hypothetical protein PSP20601_00901 [Pandoraea sputorum]
MPLHPRPSDLTIDQLRSLWLTNKDPGVRQALEELVFRREQVRRKEAVIRRVETLCVIINQAWREEVGGTLIALEWLKSALGENRESRGELPQIPGAPDK